jgi:cyclopropane fatty-acyl-phospholipid synthase-like methyltransferase
MAHRASNWERNTWAIDLLNLQLGDRVLAIGCGSGHRPEIDGQHAASGIVYGIGHSREMHSLAHKRNRNSIRAGRMKLFLASVADLPEFAKSIDKALDVNSFQFWVDLIPRNHCHWRRRWSLDRNGITAAAD